MKVDVFKVVDVKNYVDKIVKYFGIIDYFFNNVGIFGSGKFFLDIDIEEIEKIVEINLFGVLYGVCYVVEVMFKNGGGFIVNILLSVGVIG